MKNKVYFYIALSAALMSAASSCSDFLDEDNKVGQTADLTYSTAAGLESLVGSSYGYARLWYGKEAALGLSEMGTDEFLYGYDNKQKSLLSYNITAESFDNQNTDNPCLDQYWEGFFSAVDIVNTAIKMIPENNAVAENVKTQYLGEEYFLRAFYYWHMVNMWGAVPYYTAPVESSSSDAYRDSEGVVYGKMLADLDQSIDYLTRSSATKASGHITLQAAHAFKARVLLYAASWLKGQLKSDIEGNDTYAGKDLYAEAQKEAQYVIDFAASNSSELSFYDNYADCWHMSNEGVNTNKEAIWGVIYSDDLMKNLLPYRYKVNDDGESLDWNTAINRAKRTVGGGSAITLMFCGKWDNAGSDLSDVMARITDESKTFTNPKTGAVVAPATTYSQYSRGFTRHVPSLYLLDLFYKNRETDQRFQATIRDHYDVAPGLEGASEYYPLMQDTAIYFSMLDGDSPEGKALQEYAMFRYRVHFRTGGALPLYTSANVGEGKPTQSAPDVEKNPYQASVTPNFAELKSAAGCKKLNTLLKKMYNSAGYSGEQTFVALKKFEDQISTETPEISFRDMPVMRLSEMYLIKAECQLATGGNAVATINELRSKRAIAGKDNTIATCDLSTLLDERMLELVGEYQRWFDLKRTGTLIDRVRKYNPQAAAQIDEHHLLRPIPQSQIDAVTNFSTTAGSGFWQNPGY